MKIILDVWKKEFSLRSMSMRHDEQSDFYTSQWQTSREVNVVYMLYRCAIAITFFVTLVLSVVDINNLDEPGVNRAKWLIYLTHWGYAVCTVQALLACYMVLHVFMFRKVRKRSGFGTGSGSGSTSPRQQISPKLCASYWVLYTIGTDAAFAITCIYWSLIFDPKQHPLNVMNVFVHGINSMLMMTDLFVVAHPIRLLHCYWPFLFALVYVAFNVVYYLAGGTDKHGLHYVYTILDWEKPGKSATVTFCALIFLVFLHLLTYCMFLLRRRIYNQYKSPHHNNTANTYTIPTPYTPPSDYKHHTMYSEHSEYL